MSSLLEVGQKLYLLDLTDKRDEENEEVKVKK